MTILVEMDGVLLDVKPALWQAYRQAVAQIGLACTDQATFWRLTRTGADTGQLVKGAKDRHLDAYGKAFSAAAESDEAVRLMTWHDPANEVATWLTGTTVGRLLTVGSNVAARQALLVAGAENVIDAVLERVPDSPALGAGVLSKLAAEVTAKVVLAADWRLIAAADEAGLIPIGIASGACIGRRLEQRGARAVFAHLEAFAEARREGHPLLTELGLGLRDKLPDDGAETGRPRSATERADDRLARRRRRIDRRRPGE